MALRREPVPVQPVFIAVQLQLVEEWGLDRTLHPTAVTNVMSLVTSIFNVRSINHFRNEVDNWASNITLSQTNPSVSPEEHEFSNYNCYEIDGLYTVVAEEKFLTKRTHQSNLLNIIIRVKVAAHYAAVVQRLMAQSAQDATTGGLQADINAIWNNVLPDPGNRTSDKHAVASNSTGHRQVGQDARLISGRLKHGRAPSAPELQVIKKNLQQGQNLIHVMKHLGAETLLLLGNHWQTHAEQANPDLTGTAAKVLVNEVALVMFTNCIGTASCSSP